MSKPQWTKEQQDAIEARGSNVIVAAAAGAGKTAVLVERIIRHLTQPDDTGKMLDVDNLLVVTFTNAAAAEMRQRIASALAKELNEICNSQKANKKLVDHLNRQLALMGNASITTLHSFCLDIVRRHFYRLNLDPAFRIAGENEITLLKLEVLEGLFEELYSMESGNESFLRLVDTYGGARGDEELFEIVLKLQNFSRSMPWPEAWLSDVARAYRIDAAQDLDTLAWVIDLMRVIKLEIAVAKNKLEVAIVSAAQPNGPYMYIESFEQTLEKIEEVDYEKSFKSFAVKMAELENLPKLKACRDKTVDENIKVQAKKLRDDAKYIIDELRKKYFVTPIDEVIKDINNLFPIIDALVDLTVKFDNAFTLAKQEKGIVDFNDLEHFCLKILMAAESANGSELPSDVALSLREQFSEVLVDEYQDINPLQEIILKLVSRQDTQQPNMFMVGDVKQSIYRFRLTEPELFLTKYREYPTEKGGYGYRIDLAANFRSRKSILDGINFIFRQIMAEGVGEINYDDKAELVGGAAYAQADNVPTPSVEVHFINRKKEESDFAPKEQESTAIYIEDNAENSKTEIADEEDELDASQLEARLVAQRILRMVEGTAEKPNQEFHVFDKQQNAYRPVTYRDIVILLRATKGWANTLMEEFRIAGIPAYAELGSGYFEATEIETMLAVMQIIDNPRQDIYLAAVLRSPVVGLDASSLSVIRLADMKGDFYDAVKAAAVVDENDVKDNFEFKLKLNTFLDRLERWRTAARQGSLAELIWRIYRETGYYDYVGGMPGGSQRQANLRALYDRALEYEATNLRGLFRFLRFVERVRDKGNDLGAARSLGESENVVRIMSIHKSKGLEFPVVIVAGMGKEFNLMDVRSKYLLHKKAGFGIDAVDLDLRITYPTLYKKALQQKTKLETLAEEMRLLYVAMTRAREKLILVGTIKDTAKELTKWSDCLAIKGWQLPDYEMAKAKCYMHWLGSALIRHSHSKILWQAQGCDTDIDIDSAVANDLSSWEIFLHQRTDILSAEKTDGVTDELLGKVKELQPVPIQGEHYKKICAWLSWKYPYISVALKPAKVAVTEIKRRFDPLFAGEDGEKSIYKLAFERPRFMQEKRGLTPSEFGSVMHLVMQHVAFDRPLDRESILTQINEMYAKELLTSDQVQVIDVEQVTNFFISSLGQRLLKQKELAKRELPFTLALDAKDIYPDMKDLYHEEKVIVQGVIDCLFEEEHGFVLVDYKTDRIIGGKEDEIVQRYQGQLNLYAFAIESILRKPVKEKWIYLFSSGKSIQLI